MNREEHLRANPPGLAKLVTANWVFGYRPGEEGREGATVELECLRGDIHVVRILSPEDAMELANALALSAKYALGVATREQVEAEYAAGKKEPRA